MNEIQRLNEIKSKEKIIENNFKSVKNKTRVHIVPNIVHYILFDDCLIDFGHFVSILSVLQNQKPEVIYFHCNCRQLSGDYYQRAVSLSNITKTNIIVQPIEKTKIHGHKSNKTLSNQRVFDIIKIQVLKRFGGIYLDRDVYVVRSLNVCRKNNTTVQWDDTKSLRTHLIISGKDSQFLNVLLNSYLDYRPDISHYSWREVQEKRILPKYPKLVHRVKKFGADLSVVCPLVYTQYNKKWKKDFFAIRLNIRGNQLMDGCFNGTPPLVTRFDEKVVTELDTTFGEMNRNVFDFERNVIIFQI